VEVAMLAANERRAHAIDRGSKGKVREAVAASVRAAVPLALSPLPKIPNKAKIDSGDAADGTDGAGIMKPAARRTSSSTSQGESGKSAAHKYGRFAIFKSMDMGHIMDAAPITFAQNTPIDRVYDAFSKMNLVVIGIVSSTTNQYRGLITRTKLLQHTGAAHRSHEHAERSKPFWQKLREGVFGDLDLDQLHTNDGGAAPNPLPLQQRLIEYNRNLQNVNGTNGDSFADSESDRDSPSPTRQANQQPGSSSNGTAVRRKGTGEEQKQALSLAETDHAANGAAAR